MSSEISLFQDEDMSQGNKRRPLADRLRPARWEDFQGLSQFGSSLSQQIQQGKGRAPSLILWGPPGSGKTTVAKLIGKTFGAHFVELSAVLAGVKDVREVIAAAKRRREPTILFIDEVHRFNKAQQDAFLPHIEDGTIVFIGATTENPSFALNNALLSRAKVITLDALDDDALKAILERVQQELPAEFSDDAISFLVSYASGDARRMLNLLDLTFESSISDESLEITSALLKNVVTEGNALAYDRDGDEHYNLASAFIKSLRGTDPDAALYWGFRMVESGEDPRFLFRRMMIFASEDIGNADPRALQLAVAASDAYERLGLPEGKIPLAQCITYLASAPKSNRSYQGMKRVQRAIQEHPRAQVPLHIRNAPTSLMKSLNYGKNYQYPHNEGDAYVEGETYLPEELQGIKFYEPSGRGLEGKIKEKLDKLR